MRETARHQPTTSGSSSFSLQTITQENPLRLQLKEEWTEYRNHLGYMCATPKSLCEFMYVEGYGVKPGEGDSQKLFVLGKLFLTAATMMYVCLFWFALRVLNPYYEPRCTTRSCV